MHLGLYTDSVPALSLDETIGLARDVGLRSLEIAVGGQSAAPHLDLDELLATPGAVDSYLARIEGAGLRIEAINCSAWPFHPRLGDAHLELMRSGMRLAGRLGVDKVVTMSGTPGDGSDSTVPAWTWYPWPAETVALREAQWDRIMPQWEALADCAEQAGVTRVALEMHPMHLVYNAATLLRLRSALGPAIGANLDPSHLLWQRAHPPAVALALGDAVQHVHLKDIAFNEPVVATAGVLDSGSFDDPDGRAWNFATVGAGHGEGMWLELLTALRRVGYDGALCIENEDARQPQVDGVRAAAEFMAPLLQRALAA